MIVLAVAVVTAALSPLLVHAQTLPTSEACFQCHLELDDERFSLPARSYGNDVHAETGFGCLACHGSGGSDRLDPAEGFLAAPEPREIPAMCGRCHSDAQYMRQFDPTLRIDQVTEYWTSGHGEALREEDDPAVATCTDCHGSHGIRRASDPEAAVHPRNVVALCGSCHSDPALMVGRGLRLDQAERYATSVHGRMLIDEGDLSAPACNDCHGNHGAAPPGVSSLRNVCSQCHTVMADYFDQSGHASIFEEADLPGCATCHGYHAVEAASDASLGARAQDVCADCHDSSDSAGRSFSDMAGVLDSLRVRVERSRQSLEDAERRGMEVSQALFELADVNNVRSRARSAVHTFRVESVREEVQPGLEIAGRAETQAAEALDEYHSRRLGLGLSSLLIVLLIVGLILKARDLERAERS